MYPHENARGQTEQKDKKMKSENKSNQSLPVENYADQNEVARRAYELYQARGAEPGHELEDWLQAEQELNRHGQVVQSV